MALPLIIREARFHPGLKHCRPPCELFRLRRSIYLPLENGIDKSPGHSFSHLSDLAIYLIN